MDCHYSSNDKEYIPIKFPFMKLYIFCVPSFEFFRGVLSYIYNFITFIYLFVLKTEVLLMFIRLSIKNIYNCKRKVYMKNKSL